MSPLVQSLKMPTYDDKKTKDLDNTDFQKEKNNATPEKTKKMLDETGNVF
jgi:hypothetical protein